MVMADRRWSGGIYPLPPIRWLLLVVLILLLTSGKALELRSKLVENVESFEDAQRAAKVMNRKSDGVEAPESAVRNMLGELDYLNQEISSSELLEALERVESLISRLSERFSDDDGEEKMQLGEIIQALEPDAANLIPIELKLEEHSIKDALAMFELSRDTLKNMIYLLDNPGAYEEALKEVNKLIETEITPEDLDRFEAQLNDTLSLDEEMKEALTSYQDDPELLQELEDWLQESLPFFANESELQNFAHFAPKAQETCKSKSLEDQDVLSNRKFPQKSSAWAQKV